MGHFDTHWMNNESAHVHLEYPNGGISIWLCSLFKYLLPTSMVGSELFQVLQ
jgi:hypothetical protein